LQGHGNQRIVDALVDQAQRITLSSRAFHNDKFPMFARLLTSMFGYDMMLPMNTGAEGVETALKLARKWGYEKKGIPKDQVCNHFFSWEVFLARRVMKHTGFFLNFFLKTP
jgi:ornithine--oxo-acid transaminase